MLKKLWPLGFVIILSFSCQLSSQSSETTTYRHSLEVMSYNVENLFDTSHDRNNDVDKQDYMFLPFSSELKRKGCSEIRSNYWQKKCFETDWTEEKLEIKISQLKKMITRNGTKTPDFLAVSEVENEKVARMLGDAVGLENFVMTKGEDSRGIELALFYSKDKRIEKISHQEHRPSEFKSRSILEVEFRINQSRKIIFFLNHWPSQGSPAKFRAQMADMLSSRIKKLQKEDKDAAIIALGDFNTIDSDKPHPFHDSLLKKTDLKDLHSLYLDSDRVQKNDKKQLALGTYFYAPKMTWNLLDRVFVGANTLKSKKLSVDVESYHIYAPDFAVTKEVYKNRKHKHFGSVVQGVPLSANFLTTKPEKAGFSDHFPVVFNLLFN